MSAGAHRSSKSALHRAQLELWLVCVLAAFLVGQSYLVHVQTGMRAATWVFLELALFVQLAGILLLGFLLARLASALGARPRLVLFLQTLLGALQVALVFLDVRVYNLFRYHINGWVLTVLTSGGVDDSMQVDAWFWLRVVGGFLAAWLAFLWLALWRHGRLVRAPSLPSFPRWRAVLGFLLLAAATEKALYARADLLREREVPSLARLVPLYQRVTAKRLARDWFGFDLAARPRAELAGEGLALQYPLERPVMQSGGPRPNILMIAVESLRADMLEPEVMPQLWAYSQDARRFQDHASGGSTSRYGTFAMIYGLHGSYFAPVYAENTSPVLVDALLELGYEFRIWGTASMSFPELRSTAWVKVEDKVEDALPRTPKASRDAELVKRFGAWMAQRQATQEKRPFFCFAFVDAPHANYNLHTGVTPFVPFAEQLDYFDLTGDAAKLQAQSVFNRYKNAVYDADTSIGTMLRALEASGEAAQTLVIITGDHGEEFQEHGFWGHTSNFTRTQVLVPLVLRGPGIEPGVEERPTSHVDLAPTILEYLGASPLVRERWCTGENLLDPPAGRERVVAGWDTLGLWTKNAIVVLPLAAHGGASEAYDYDWQPVRDLDQCLREAAGAIGATALECRRFLR